MYWEKDIKYNSFAGWRRYDVQIFVPAADTLIFNQMIMTRLCCTLKLFARLQIYIDVHIFSIEYCINELVFSFLPSMTLQFIGWQEVPRPTSRTEIVHAMRRIRVRQHVPMPKNWPDSRVSCEWEFLDESPYLFRRLISRKGVSFKSICGRLKPLCKPFWSNSVLNKSI